MSQPRNVFISWSGDRSRTVALKLREWLPRVVQSAKPWMSDADIAKGSRGLNELTKTLYAMKVGITCLSPDNLEAPWLLFEAGAISKAIDDTSRLCTYLLDGLKPEDVKPPMGMFQATKATKQDTRKLIQTISESVSDEPLREEELDEVFEAMWPSLETVINSLPLIEPSKSVKRNAEDMIAEILDIVRADANRKQARARRIRPIDGITTAQVEAIKAAVHRQNKFLGELVEHASQWELERGELVISFPEEKRTFAEMLEGREPLARLCAVVNEVLGTPVQVRTAMDIAF